MFLARYMQKKYLKIVEKEPACKKTIDEICGNFGVKSILMDTWPEIEYADELSTSLYRELDAAIEKQLLQLSPIDLHKLVNTMQHVPQDYAVLTAMTDYTCASCQEKGIWGSIPAPPLCKNCMTILAKKIMLGDIWK